MRKKMIAFVFLTVLSIFIFSYYLSAKKFEKNLHLKESLLEKDFFKDFSLLKNTLNEPMQFCINQKFDVNAAKILIDTSISFSIFPVIKSYTKFENSYLNCLVSKCEVEINLNKEIELVREILEQLTQRIYSKAEKDKLLGDNMLFLNEIKKENICNKEHMDLYNYELDSFAIEDYKKYLMFLKINDLAINKLIFDEKNKLINAVKSVRRDLNNIGENYFFERFNEDNLIIQRDSIITFNGENLGRIDIKYLITKFNPNPLNLIFEDALKEQYRNNSLVTGSMPYAKCFGSSNYCNGSDCSEIQIYTSSSSDVLVSIKKDEKVYRHAYIKAGSNFTFNLPNGAYQTFFYYGTGWNPVKKMNSNSCRSLRGGFISDVHVGKSDLDYLTNNILTFELILQTNGNFSEAPSSTDEAF